VEENGYGNEGGKAMRYATACFQASLKRQDKTARWGPSEGWVALRGDVGANASEIDTGACRESRWVARGTDAE
jgi:hypothetical protein